MFRLSFCKDSCLGQGLKFWFVRVGAPTAALEGINIGHILGGNLEIEDLSVGEDSLWFHRFGKGDYAMLEAPP